MANFRVARGQFPWAFFWDSSVNCEQLSRPQLALRSLNFVCGVLIFIIFGFGPPVTSPLCFPGEISTGYVALVELLMNELMYDSYPECRQHLIILDCDSILYSTARW